MAINMDAILSLASKIRPDPLTGKIDMDSLNQHIMENFEDPDVRKTLKHAHEQLGFQDTKIKDLAKFDFNSLPVQPNTMWLVKLQFGGMRDANGRPVSSNKASSQQGVRQSFHLHSWIKVGHGVGQDMYRLMEEYIGMPTSKQVEDFIRQSMAMPYPAFTPCIPHGLLLSNNLSHHKAALSPFLDSLPSPFSWKVAPEEVEAVANQLRQADKAAKLQRYITLAKEKKDEGNKRHAAKNYQAAVECYQDSLQTLYDAVSRLSLVGDDDMTREVRGLQAICFANSSSARLLTGRREDIKNAIEDAKSAIELDEIYPKGYVRLSRAYEALGNIADAEDAIVQALRLPQLENNQGLVDHLISLQAGGNGLPTDVEAFNKWYKETFSEGQERATRMQGVGGLWLKVCKEHLEKMKILSSTPKN